MEWIQENWVQIGVLYILVHNFLKGLATAIDKDPTTDTKFERFVKFLGSFTSYMTTGKR